MAIGFTGTRAGMTRAQKQTLTSLLYKMLDEHGPGFREGEAIGADTEAKEIASAIGYDIDPFPANGDPLGRNRIIVNGSSHLIATPHQPYEIRRSGTWMTIRYARRQGIPVTIIRPDGTKDYV